MYTFYVKHNGRTFGVYASDGTTEELIENGFFSKRKAEEARDQWERECLQSEVEDAERRAGWDPNP